MALAAVRRKPKCNKCPPPYQANAVLDPITGDLYEYRSLSTGPDAATWIRALANDFGRLAQGVGERMPTGNNTIFFIPRTAVPKKKTVTYGRLVSNICPLKLKHTVSASPLEVTNSTTTATHPLHAPQ